MEVLVLALLADGPQYGYALQRRLGDASGQMVQPGTLYPLMHRLESAGFVEPTWEKTTGRPRKWYRLTSAGRQQLTTQAAEWQALLAKFQAVVLPALRQVVAYPENEKEEKNS